MTVDTDAVRACNPIEVVIGERIELKRVRAELVACCPFHPEKTPSFTVSPTKQFYHCFGCGAHGDVIDFVQEFDRVGFVEAVRVLGGEVSSFQNSPSMQARAAAQQARAWWRQFASEVFDVRLDAEQGIGWADDSILFDLHRLRGKALRRARGESLPLSGRERGIINYFCSRRSEWRDEVRGMYGL